MGRRTVRVGYDLNSLTKLLGKLNNNFFSCLIRLLLLIFCLNDCQSKYFYHFRLHRSEPSSPRYHVVHISYDILTHALAMS